MGLLGGQWSVAKEVALLILRVTTSSLEMKDGKHLRGSELGSERIVSEFMTLKASRQNGAVCIQGERTEGCIFKAFQFDKPTTC